MAARYLARQCEAGWEVFDTQDNKVCDGITNDPFTEEGARVMARYLNNGKCPMCPAEPMKERRSRCPICKEWINYVPDHPGHKHPTMRGRRVVWAKTFFKPAQFAFMGHTNANAATHTGKSFVEAFYEPAGTP